MSSAARNERTYVSCTRKKVKYKIKRLLTRQRIGEKFQTYKEWRKSVEKIARRMYKIGEEWGRKR